MPGKHTAESAPCPASPCMDLIGICAYDISMQYHEWLMSRLRIEPPPNHKAVSILLEADRAAWLRLAEKLPDGIKRTGAGACPMDIHLPSMQTDPLSRSSKGRSVLQMTFQTSHGQRFPEAQVKAKMPDSLVGKWSTTKRGVPIWWMFNTAEGCPRASAGGRCARGMHLCAEPNCQKNHSLVDHKSQNPIARVNPWIRRHAFDRRP